jgi:5-methyltetrahydrofolate--homocysteine methyltransferase
MLLVDKHLKLSEIGISVTENGAMAPTASVAGLYIANPAATYFSIGTIADDQIADYAQRRSMTADAIRSLLRL